MIFVVFGNFPYFFPPLLFQVITTAGNSDGLDKIFSTILSAGDYLFLEELNFIASISILEPLRGRGILVTINWFLFLFPSSRFIGSKKIDQYFKII